MGTIVSRRMVGVVSAVVACLFLLALTHNAAYAADGKIKFKILLHPPAKIDAPKGKAKYEERTDGRKKLNVEVEHIPDTTTIEVFVDGESVGLGVITGCAAEIELDTKKGDTVPTMTESSLVEVFDADTDGKLLTSA